MFQRLTAFILLIAMVASTFDRAVIVFDYYTNTAAFAKNCVNKARPKMHCNGKCQMMKKLQQEEKKDQDNPERKLENKLELFAWQSLNTFIPVNYHIVAAHYQSGNTGKPVNVTVDIFHPPGIA